MNQTQSSTISRSKTYEITITALMTAVTCILAPMSIPIKAGSDFIHQSGNLSVPVSSRMEKRNHQLSDLSFDRSCRAPGILRFHWHRRNWQAYRWIDHRIYRNGSHCRTVHRQLPQTMDPAYRYDRRNHRMLPFGTVWFCIVAGFTFQAALAVCVIPFIPADLVKMIIAMIIGSMIKKRIR